MILAQKQSYLFCALQRKTGPAITKEKGSRKRSRSDAASTTDSTAATAPVNPVLAGILQRSSAASMEKQGKAPPASATSAKLAVGKGVRHHLNGYLQQSAAKASSSRSQQELAQSAVGKGVRHGLAVPVSEAAGSATEALASASMIFPDPPQLGFPDLQDSLSELTNNFRNSLQGAESLANHPGEPADETTDQANELDPAFQMYNFLSRDSSLVDLAMLMPMTNADATEQQPDQTSVEPTSLSEMADTMMPFVDFPSMEAPTENDETG